MATIAPTGTYNFTVTAVPAEARRKQTILRLMLTMKRSSLRNTPMMIATTRTTRTRASQLPMAKVVVTRNPIPASWNASRSSLG